MTPFVMCFINVYTNMFIYIKREIWYIYASGYVDSTLKTLLAIFLQMHHATIGQVEQNVISNDWKYARLKIILLFVDMFMNEIDIKLFTYQSYAAGM